METIRKPLQGVKNIIRFNWHFYILAIVLVIMLLTIQSIWSSTSPFFTVLPALLIFLTTLVSVLVSAHIYDFSELYSLNWLNQRALDKSSSMVNINAGFDETSALLVHKYPNTSIAVLDFYNPKKHTEVSIQRARKAYPPYPNTIKISTDHIPLLDKTTETIFAILSAHEIRNEEERIVFFKELQRILKEDGNIIVTEHLRDLPNFLAYTIGFLHFHSKNTWLRTFDKARLKVIQEIKITPFLTTFILQNA